MSGAPPPPGAAFDRFSVLDLRSAVRKGTQVYLDIYVDGRRLADILDVGDSIPPLGWLPANDNDLAVDRLLLVRPADWPANRISIYVCGECADPGCGAVTVSVERTADTIVWRDFAIEYAYLEDVQPILGVGPFRFQADAYARVLTAARAIGTR